MIYLQNMSAATFVILSSVPIVFGILGYFVYQSVGTTAADAECHSNDQLLGQLYRLHQIGSQHRALLQAISDSAGVAHPTVLFVMPDEFDAAIEVAKQKIPFSAQDQRAIGLLRRQMFE